MNPEPLPPNLRELEVHLARRPLPAAGDDFRARVLGTMAGASLTAGPDASSRRWQYFWRCAVAAVIALNAWMCAANGFRFQRFSALTEPPATQPTPGADRESNDRLDSLGASALANLRPTADFRPGGRGLFNLKEEREWGTP